MLVQIEKDNPVTQEEAIKTIKAKMHSLLAQYVTIRTEILWELRGCLPFLFLVYIDMGEKVTLESIKGTISVTDSKIIIGIEIPKVVKIIISEDKIKQVISEEFDKMFV